MTASHFLPFSSERPLGLFGSRDADVPSAGLSSAVFSGSRFPKSCSTPEGTTEGRPISRRRDSMYPRLKWVTLWPRASADSVHAGPRKPVPPRIRMRRDLVAARGESAAPRRVGAKAPEVTASVESARKCRRLSWGRAEVSMISQSCQRRGICANQDVITRPGRWLQKTQAYSALRRIFTAGIRRRAGAR